MSHPPERQAGTPAGDQAEATAPSPLLRIVLAPLRLVVAIVVILDELARPAYRPLARWFASLALIRRAERRIAELPPYAVLFVLAVPLVGVEPLKILGVYWIGTGRWLAGLLLLGFAYLASFLVVERIYEAGHEKLMRIGWFRAVMAFVVRIRDTVMAWARGTALWVHGRRIALELKALAVRTGAGLRRLFGGARPPIA